MTDNSIFSDFKEIFRAWTIGKSGLIVYDLIADWIEKYKNVIPYKLIIHTLEKKMEDINDYDEFIEYFLYDEECLLLRLTYDK
jgi:hypothetical protein